MWVMPGLSTGMNPIASQNGGDAAEAAALQVMIATV